MRSTTHPSSASTTASRRRASARRAFPVAWTQSSQHRSRGIHDPHWRGRERGVPATRRAVQLHRLVRLRTERKVDDAQAARTMQPHSGNRLDARRRWRPRCVRRHQRMPHAPLGEPIVITPSSGCGLLTAYTAGTGLPAWSGPAPSCGSGAFTLGFNQGNTPPPATLSHSRGVATAGSALCRLGPPPVCPTGRGWATRSVAPPGLTITKVEYDASQLQNIANGRGWIGFTYWNGGTAQVHPDGTAVDAAASGPLNTNYWGIELRCVQAVCTWPGEIQLNSLTVYAAEAQGPTITPVGGCRQLVGPGWALDLEPAG